MEAGAIAGLVTAAAVLALLWPSARRMAASGAPMLRWAIIWLAALGAVGLAYAYVLAPLGIGLR
jgi:hypothetical protein